MRALENKDAFTEMIFSAIKMKIPESEIFIEIVFFFAFADCFWMLLAYSLLIEANFL